jgi:Leucine-rich repeat (LRR) protein
LSNNQIEHLPRAICLLPDLHTLKLDNNKIQRIDETIELFPQKRVTLHHNLLQKIHCDFQEINVDLSHNELTEFPSHLLRNPQRETINVACNKITYFELDSVQEDSKLKEFNISYNQLLSLPEGLEQFLCLEKLNFSQNQLTKIPLLLFQHKKLQSFYFYKNKVDFLPSDLSKMRNLAYLNFQSNQIKSLPIKLPVGIKSFEYSDNPIPKESEDIFKLLLPEGYDLPF